MSADSKGEKRTVKWLVFFTLLGSAQVKAAHRTLMKLTPDVIGFIRVETLGV